MSTHARRLIRRGFGIQAPYEHGALHHQDVPAVRLSLVTGNTAARAFHDRVGFHEIAVPEPGPVTCLGRNTAATPPR